MTGDPQPTPAFRWIAAGFLGGVATVGLVWTITTRPGASPAEPEPSPAPRIVRPTPAEPIAPRQPEPSVEPQAESQNADETTETPSAPAEAKPEPETQPETEPETEPDDKIDATTESSPLPPEPAADTTTRIRINTATAAELDLLPGIGPALAARIIASRRADGPFHEPKDLERVPGIGVKTAERMAPLIRFD